MWWVLFVWVAQAAAPPPNWAQHVALERSTLPPARAAAFGDWCQHARRTAQTMRELQHHVDIGLGIDLRGASRSYDFSEDPLQTSVIAREYLRCLPKELCAGVKHFPGIGALKTDPHRDSDSETFSVESHWLRDLLPFVTAVDEGACVVMTSHLRLQTTEVKPTVCTFDSNCVDVLRQDLGYDGVILADEVVVMTAARAAMVDLVFRPVGLADTQWDALSPVQRRSLAIEARLRRRCGGPESCSAAELRAVTDEVDDVNGSRRMVLAIQAGHDMVLQFRLPNSQPDHLRQTVAVVAQAVASGQISISQIDASVLRILELKKRVFGEELYGNFPGATSAQSLLSRLTLRQKVMQMMAVDGRYEREDIEQLGLGALYLPGPDADPKSTAVPMLFLGDAMYGSRRRWGSRL
jgi:beta-glucosidase-like glycosyl hydrolase